MEFTGPALEHLAFEEQAVLSNMAVECNALTAIMAPSEPMIQYLVEKRGLARDTVEKMLVFGDAGSTVDRLIELDLGEVRTLVAKPGHPGNGVPLDEVRGKPVDIAYAGSCTAGGYHFDCDVRGSFERPTSHDSHVHSIRIRACARRSKTPGPSRHPDVCRRPDD